MNVQSIVGPDGVPMFSLLLNEWALRKFRIAVHTVLHNSFNSGTVSLAKITPVNGHPTGQKGNPATINVNV